MKSYAIYLRGKKDLLLTNTENLIELIENNKDRLQDFTKKLDVMIKNEKWDFVQFKENDLPHVHRFDWYKNRGCPLKVTDSWLSSVL